MIAYRSVPLKAAQAQNIFRKPSYHDWDFNAFSAHSEKYLEITSDSAACQWQLRQCI